LFKREIKAIHNRLKKIFVERSLPVPGKRKNLQINNPEADHQCLGKETSIVAVDLGEKRISHALRR